MKNTDPAVFFEQIEGYMPLSEEAKREWEGLLKPRSYSRGMEFLRVGQVPRRVAFVVKGLFSQSYITDSGDTVIKYFFPEGRIAGSVPAILNQSVTRRGVMTNHPNPPAIPDYSPPPLTSDPSPPLFPHPSPPSQA